MCHRPLYLSCAAVLLCLMRLPSPLSDTHGKAETVSALPSTWYTKCHATFR